MAMRTPGYDPETRTRKPAAADTVEQYFDPVDNSYKVRTITKPLPQLQGFGYVDPHEEAEAKRIIDEQLTKEFGGPFTVRVCGFFIALKIYVRPEELKAGVREDGSTYSLWIPQKAQQGDKYQAASALVLGVGPQAYKGYNADGSQK